MGPDRHAVARRPGVVPVASLEYKFTATTVNGSVAGGDSRSSLRTNHLVFGLGFQLKR